MGCTLFGGAFACSVMLDPVKTAKRTYDDYKTFTDVKATTEGESYASDRERCFLKCVVATIIRPESFVSPGRAPSRKRCVKIRRVSWLCCRGSRLKSRRRYKRVYDDSKFVQSLSEQVTMGKRLSDRQVAFLDSLVGKYGDQIENFEAIKAELKLGEQAAANADPTTARYWR